MLPASITGCLLVSSALISILELLVLTVLYYSVMQLHFNDLKKSCEFK